MVLNYSWLTHEASGSGKIFYQIDCFPSSVFILSLDIQDNILPYTDGKASHTHTETHTETHTHEPVKEKLFFTPGYISFYRNLHWFFSLNTQGFTLISMLTGETEKMIRNRKRQKSQKNSHSCLQLWMPVTIAFIFFTYSPELLVKKIIHCLPIVGTNESWPWLWDAGGLPGREWGRKDA